MFIFSKVTSQSEKYSQITLQFNISSSKSAIRLNTQRKHVPPLPIKGNREKITTREI